jgi:hypothetical protein
MGASEVLLVLENLYYWITLTAPAPKAELSTENEDLEPEPTEMNQSDAMRLDVRYQEICAI